MRYIVFTAAVILLAGCAVTRPRYSIPTDIEKNNLNGRVVSVRSIYLDLNGWAEDDPQRPTDFDMILITRYNSAGNIVSEETFSQGGGTGSRRDLYFFDSTGRFLQTCEYHDLVNNKLTWIKYDYGKKGRLENYHAVADSWMCCYEYGSRGYPKAMTSIVDDTVNHIVVYSYDRRGRLVKETIDEALTRYEYHRNNKLKRIYKDYYTEEYNANGDLHRIVNLIRLHDDGGVETKEGVVDAVYQYDEFGNWIRRELHSDGEFFGVWVREIEYAP